MKLRVWIHAFAIKPVKKRGGGGAIKTTVVKAQSYFGHGRSFGPFPWCQLLPETPAKPLTMLGKGRKVKHVKRTCGKDQDADRIDVRGMPRQSVCFVFSGYFPAMPSAMLA